LVIVQTTDFSTSKGAFIPISPSAHTNKMIIAKEVHNTYKQQIEEGKLIYKENNHITIKLITS